MFKQFINLGWTDLFILWTPDCCGVAKGKLHASQYNNNHSGN